MRCTPKKPPRGRSREQEGKSTTQSRYFLLSTSLLAERFLAVTRAHWAIENSLHGVLNVTMNEDRARNRKQEGPENLRHYEASGPQPGAGGKVKRRPARQAQKSRMA